jgi:membrane-associated phospholipid phosphatase
MRQARAVAVQWGMVVESLTRPYRVSVPMITLVALVPLYIVIAAAMPGGQVHVPALPLDRMIPLQPAWALVYGALYFFLIALPVFVVREEVHLRRTVLAYLVVWITAYLCFLVYPTVAPRPTGISGNGFALWGLRFLYSADPPYNCFPSLHVAHSVVSAVTCHRVHRRVGMLAMVCAALVALSTLFTKQHYLLDVVAGIALACAACALFLRGVPSAKISELDRRLAPTFALGTLAVAIIGTGCFWALYRLKIQL